MNDLIKGIVIGIFIGANLGVLLMAILRMAKDPKDIEGGNQNEQRN